MSYKTFSLFSAQQNSDAVTAGFINERYYHGKGSCTSKGFYQIGEARYNFKIENCRNVVGSSVPIHYNSKNPSENYAEDGNNFIFLNLFFTFIMFCVAAFMLLRGPRFDSYHDRWLEQVGLKDIKNTEEDPLQDKW